MVSEIYSKREKKNAPINSLWKGHCTLVDTACPAGPDPLSTLDPSLVHLEVEIHGWSPFLESAA